MIIVISVLGGILILFLLLAILYLTLGWNKWLFHNILGWHKPIREKTLNGINIISKCNTVEKK